MRKKIYPVIVVLSFFVLGFAPQTAKAEGGQWVNAANDLVMSQALGRLAVRTRPNHIQANIVVEYVTGRNNTLSDGGNCIYTRTVPAGTCAEFGGTDAAANGDGAVAIYYSPAYDATHLESDEWACGDPLPDFGTDLNQPTGRCAYHYGDYVKQDVGSTAEALLLPDFFAMIIELARAGDITGGTVWPDFDNTWVWVKD